MWECYQITSIGNCRNTSTTSKRSITLWHACEISNRKKKWRRKKKLVRHTNFWIWCLSSTPKKLYIVWCRLSLFVSPFDNSTITLLLGSVYAFILLFTLTTTPTAWTFVRVSKEISPYYVNISDTFLSSNGKRTWDLNSYALLMKNASTSVKKSPFCNYVGFFNFSPILFSGNNSVFTECASVLNP